MPLYNYKRLKEKKAKSYDFWKQFWLWGTPIRVMGTLQASLFHLENHASMSLFIFLPNSSIRCRKRAIKISYYIEELCASPIISINISFMYFEALLVDSHTCMIIVCLIDWHFNNYEISFSISGNTLCLEVYFIRN